MRTLTLIAPLLLPTLAFGQADLIERAKAIHKRVLTLDTHKDINPTLALGYSGKDPEGKRPWDVRNDPTVDGSNQVDFPKMRKGGLDCAFYIVYTGQRRLDGAGFLMAKRQAMLKFDAIHRMAKKYPEHIGLATTADQVEALYKKGKLIAAIGIENGYPMGKDLSLVEKFHELGARYMGIAHTGHSQLGDAHRPAEPLHGGLSKLGMAAVAEMNRVGIMVDISHGSDSTMSQAMALSKAPVLASHSGVDGVREHTRNLNDAHLLQLKQNGGVIQIVALGSFIRDTSKRTEAMSALRNELGLPGRRELYRMREAGMSEAMQKKLDAFNARVKTEIDPKHPQASVMDLADHVDYAVKKIGIEHVAISSDFDGGGGIVGWNTAAETFNVTLELVKRGYTEKQIGMLWSGNTLRVWRAVERVAKEIQATKK